MQPLKIAFVSSEVHPFSKTGGLADVSSSLPQALARAGHDVRVFTPLYAKIDRTKFAFEPQPAIKDVAIRFGQRNYGFSLKTSVPPGAEGPVYFVDAPELFGRPEMYTKDADEHVRFGLFARAVIESAQRMQWAPDVFHCHDWHASLVPLYLKTLYAWDMLFKDSRTVLTIHNIGYQGAFPSSVLGDLSLADSAHLLDAADLKAGVLNFLKTGILFADRLTTVSRTYAHEIQTPEYGVGLDELLQQRRGALTGIVNGVDYQEWDPSVDTLIPFRYSAKSLTAKGKDKKALAARLNIEHDAAAPLIGIVSRLTGQKGFDLCKDVLPELLGGTDLRLAVLGTGESAIERFFEGLAARFPGRVGFFKGFDNALAHLIEAGSDMFLMPSRYEPCGLNQMYSMKYGTIPVVRKTGGLADTVTQFNPATGEGTGFVFEHFTPQGLRWAIGTALEVWPDRKAWKRLVLNAMAQDFSWDVQVREYVDLYGRLAGRVAA